MRLISFSMTKAAFLDGSKTVTRRLGWKSVKPGDFLMGVEKAQGLKKGEKVKMLGPLQVVSVRRERLNEIDGEDVRREGFPDMKPVEFVRLFCKAHGSHNAGLEVTRIEFKRVMGECPNCEAEGITPTAIICDECVVESGLMDCVGEKGCPVEAPGWSDGDEVTCRACGMSFVARCDEGRVTFREVARA